MLDVLSISGVIFVLTAAGYAAVLGGMLPRAALPALGRYVTAFALPALIFRSVSGMGLGAILDPGYIGAYLTGALAVFGFGYWLARGPGGRGGAAATFDAMGMSCANSGFVGYPVLLMAMPAVAGKALALNMIAENLVLVPLVLVLAARSQGGAGTGAAALRRIGANLARNPIVLALLAGLAVAALGVPLPVIITRPVELVAQSSAAVSLIVIGGTLAGLPFGAIGARVFSITAGKLLLLPLAVWAALALFAAAGLTPRDPALAQAAVIMAATPAMSIYPILAQAHGEEETAALAMLVMTVLSFFTLSALLYLLGVPG